MTSSDARRAFGWIAWLAVLMNAGQYILGVWPQLARGTNNALVLFDYGRSFVYMAWIAPLLAVLPFGTGFCSDWSSQYILPQITRIGEKRYTRSKLLAAGLSGGLALSAGALVFFGICCLSMPLAGYETLFGYGPNLTDAVVIGGAYLYIASSCYLYFLGGAFYAVASLAFSAWWPTPFFALILPLVINKLSTMLAARLALPFYLNIGMMVDGAVGLYYAPTMIVSTLVLGGLIAICCVLFTAGVKRRLQNG